MIDWLVSDPPTVMIESVYLPSRIRRGRASTNKTWIVTRNGVQLYFARKKDALAFATEGCAAHDSSAFSCPTCLGRRNP